MPGLAKGRRSWKTSSRSKSEDIGRYVEQKMVGRETEMANLISFIRTNIKGETAASLYVSGLPGTGKTMCVKKAVEESKSDFEIRSVWINCMNFASINDFYETVIERLDNAKKNSRKRPAPSDGVTSKDVEKRLCSGSTMILMCLDEIDQFEKRFPTMLTRIFEWPSLPDSRVLLIGIANSFDLTDRCLKKLDMSTDVKPRVLHFRPYTTEEVVAIVREHFAKYTDSMHPKALELCARKCASISGDVRKALETCKTALDRAALRTEDGDSSRQLDDSFCGTSEVLDVLQDTYSPTTRNSRYETLPLQQRLLFASALALSSSGSKQFSIGQLYDQYTRICKSTHMPTVDDSEARSFCDLLQVYGLLRKISRPNQPIKYTLDVAEKIAREIIKEDRLLSAVLDEKA